MKADVILPTLDIKQAQSVRCMVDQAHEVVMVCHVSPDGDAIGSTLAMYHVLRLMGKRPWVVTPDMPPRSLGFLSGVHDIVVASQKPWRAEELVGRADLIICLDFNAMMRLDKISGIVASSPARKLLIDHHLYPEGFADLTISHPEASSTCYLLYNVLVAAGMSDMIGREAAECIFTGMMTDTGGFTYNSNDPGLYTVTADLLRRGVDKDKLYKLVFDTAGESRLRICGYAIYRKMIIFAEHQASVISLTKSELDEFEYAKGDTESLVNKPLAMPGVTYSVFLRQDDDNFVKVSARSKGHFPVNKLCELYFGGGGHENAAGGEFYGTLDEAMCRLVEAMPEFDKYLPENPEK